MFEDVGLAILPAAVRGGAAEKGLKNKRRIRVFDIIRNRRMRVEDRKGRPPLWSFPHDQTYRNMFRR